MMKRHGTSKKFDDLLRLAALGPELFGESFERSRAEFEEVFERRFGRLTKREPRQPTAEQLKNLAESMEEGEGSPGADSDVPIGMAFIGQFVDHDLTLEATTRLAQMVGDVTEIENFRTPRLELDSVYLNGPEVSPYLYHPKGFTLLLGTSANPLDLQRNRCNTAIIGDPRNDENIFISQLHGVFIRAHNAILRLIGGTNPTLDHFEQARRTLRSVYQNIVVFEFLPAVVTAQVLDPLLEGFRKGELPGPVDWKQAPDMPIEFAAAAYRFGHSMIREEYVLNKSGKRIKLFENGAFSPVPVDHNLDLELFFDLDAASFQKARRIDTLLVPELFKLPGVTHTSLAERNLLRGQLTFELPYGEDLADMWYPKQKVSMHPSVSAAGLAKTPLWFYCLAEAEAFGGKLGPVGGTLVAGTILNVLIRDPGSIARSTATAEAPASAKVTPTLKGLLSLAKPEGSVD